MKAFIVTGASKGLGEAIASRIIMQGDTVFSLSRSRNAGLEEQAKKTGANIRQIRADLTDHESVHSLMSSIFSEIALDELDGIYLINNAGMVGPVGPVQENDHLETAKNLALNLTAPILLCSEFIKRTEGVPIEKRIMNISSGAARKPYEGWSSYCASKAGLDHFTRCAAEEQKRISNGVKLVSIAPGVVDTSMQEHIRGLKEGLFPQQNRFVQLKEQGKLYSPALAAEKLMKELLHDSFGREPVMDIRDQ
ncbi:(S)-benzoin forming benzil reductase [Bacillus mangrovi]|uniref:(S)-benzoin forming benzil reductase n=1 Tax=Metabacillus mangrovi TaxID=1491830 RepID=A0A7X2V3C7_9BACI|nr:(S)-benzoin forming benzil reductase [Metabacillus mangrovi]MTH51959.1 (S)-benzoin forming benzil reductase [Metabacillus mangrovi]